MSESGTTMNTLTFSASTPPPARVGWQCPGCRVHYSPDVSSCSCGSPVGTVPQVTVWPTWYWPYSSVPGCAPYPGWVLTYNANLAASPSASLTG